MFDGIPKNQSPESWPSEPRIDDINQTALLKIVESMLAEKDDKEVIKEGFIWRAIYLYSQEIVAKINKDEIEEFYEKIKPELIKILNLKQIKYNFNEKPIKKGDGEKNNQSWITEWENRQI